jgi:hypothetical protein
MKLSNIPGDLVIEFTRKIAVRYSGSISAAVKDLMMKALKE